MSGQSMSEEEGMGREKNLTDILQESRWKDTRRSVSWQIATRGGVERCPKQERGMSEIIAIDGKGRWC